MFRIFKNKIKRTNKYRYYISFIKEYKCDYFYQTIGIIDTRKFNCELEKRFNGKMEVESTKIFYKDIADAQAALEWIESLYIAHKLSK